MPSALTVASVPPAIITSASPYSINRPASPMQWFDDEHADTIARLGPWNPYWIDASPATMLTIVPGTKNGVILRQPPASNATFVSSISGRPPMPDPMQTPTRSLSPA